MKIEATDLPLVTPASDPAELRKSAGDFEAIMLQEILGSAIPGNGDAYHGLALQAVARELAPAISFGLAQLLEKQA